MVVLIMIRIIIEDEAKRLDDLLLSVIDKSGISMVSCIYIFE